MISGPATIPARTVFGNIIDGSAPFSGLLREMRFWTINRSEKDLENFRYQTIPLTSELRNSMLLYIMLNQGSGTQLV